MGIGIENLRNLLRAFFGGGSDITVVNPLPVKDPVVLEMAPFNTLYLPLSETATAGLTTTVDHFPAENRAWYVSKVYITTTTNTTAKLKIKCDNDGVLGDVEATIPKATTALEIDLKAEYGMPLRV
ncbi:unnamed protein product, partial [marine sediment metagenome]